jgi:hypothetical protein
MDGDIPGIHRSNDALKERVLFFAFFVEVVQLPLRWRSEKVVEARPADAVVWEDNFFVNVLIRAASVEVFRVLFIDILDIYNP